MVRALALVFDRLKCNKQTNKQTNITFGPGVIQIPNNLSKQLSRIHYVVALCEQISLTGVQFHSPRGHV